MLERIETSLACIVFDERTRVPFLRAELLVIIIIGNIITVAVIAHYGASRNGH